MEVNFVKDYLYPELIGIGSEPYHPKEYAIYAWSDGEWTRVSDYTKSWKNLTAQYNEIVARVKPEIEKKLNEVIENEKREKKAEQDAKRNKKTTRDEEYVKLGRDCVTIYYAFRYHGAMYQFNLSYDEYMKKLRNRLTKSDLHDILQEAGLYKEKMTYESMLSVLLRTPALRNQTKAYFRSVAYREYDSEQMRKLLT